MFQRRFRPAIAIVILGAALALASLAALGPAFAQATPPDHINYQGVLRDAAGQPLTGTFSMIFRYFDTESAGNEILEEWHDSYAGNLVPVSQGIFSVQLGSGPLWDGEGPGNYNSLGEVFRDFSSVWLELQVNGETLAPRVEFVSAPYAINAAHINGRAASDFLDTSAIPQTKAGTLAVGPVDFGKYLSRFHAIKSQAHWTWESFNGAPGYVPINAQFTTTSELGGSTNVELGTGYGFICGEGQSCIDMVALKAVDGASSVELAGIHSYSPPFGVYSTSQGHGIWADGVSAGGRFGDLDGSGYASVGVGNRGLEAFGSESGGYFKDSDSVGYAHLASGAYGIRAYGGDQHQTSAANFTNPNGAVVDLAYTEFEMAAPAAAYSYGIRTTGALGGSFSNSSSNSTIASNGYGFYGEGNTAGGYFEDRDQSGYSYVGSGDRGIQGYGGEMGAYFKDLNDSSFAYIAWSNEGVCGYGSREGGYFADVDDNPYARISFGSYKILGNGAVSFAQNHPAARDQVIVYAAPEGDEVAVYTRGTARLIGGEARVPLGETFKWVTNPDIGLTVHLTPVGAWSDLYVVSKGTEEIVVKSGGGDSDAVFDYIVYGLRIGFEASSVVQVKEQESPIPDMTVHEQFYAARPELRGFSALERFKGMQAAADLDSKLDLSHAVLLKAAIQGATLPLGTLPERHPKPPAEATGPLTPATPTTPAGPAQPAAASATRERAAAIVTETADPASSAAGPLFPVSEAVEPGDLLVLDPLRPGQLKRCDAVGSTGVAGVVAAEAITMNGQLQAPLASSLYALVKADAAFAAIRAGDLLTTSPTPGHAMLALEALPGTVIGKALEPLEAGAGVIRVLLLAR